MDTIPLMQHSSDWLSVCSPAMRFLILMRFLIYGLRLLTLQTSGIQETLRRGRGMDCIGTIFVNRRRLRKAMRLVSLPKSFESRQEFITNDTEIGRVLECIYSRLNGQRGCYPTFYWRENTFSRQNKFIWYFTKCLVRMFKSLWNVGRKNQRLKKVEAWHKEKTQQGVDKHAM